MVFFYIIISYHLLHLVFFGLIPSQAEIRSIPLNFMFFSSNVKCPSKFKFLVGLCGRKWPPFVLAELALPHTLISPSSEVDFYLSGGGGGQGQKCNHGNVEKTDQNNTLALCPPIPSTTTTSFDPKVIPLCGGLFHK